MIKTYVLDLVQRVVTAFVLTLAGLAAAAEPFDVLTFQWDVALTTSTSVAVLTLLTGLAARFSGDKNSAGFTK